MDKSANFTQFGKEWQAELMRCTKKQLITLLRESYIQYLGLKVKWVDRNKVSS